MNEIEEKVESLQFYQMKDWELAYANYVALSEVKTRVYETNQIITLLQYNLQRIRSSAANIDKATLEARPCFFCLRPEEQASVDFNDAFEILVNPYPIFENHLTIPLRWHEPQQIKPYFQDMVELAATLNEYAIFYNGPMCGASAPDHMHFQAGDKYGFPIVKNIGKISKTIVKRWENTTLYASHNCLPAVFWLASSDWTEANMVFDLIYDQLKVKPGEYEPMMNVLMWRDDEEDDNEDEEAEVVFHTCIFPRRELRPSCYYAEGDANILISPATVEMSGLFIVPRESDFEKVTFDDLRKVWEEVSITEDEMKEIIQKINQHD